MNPHDRKNLEFLMAVSPEVLCDWYQSVSEDDVIYALELLKYASEEMERAELVAAAHECLDLFNENIDCTEAKAVISKFTLKGSK